jgi:hypothetical protein
MCIGLRLFGLLSLGYSRPWWGNSGADHIKLSKPHPTRSSVKGREKRNILRTEWHVFHRTGQQRGEQPPTERDVHNIADGT